MHACRRRNLKRLEAVIEYLVKRVKELKSDTRKLNNKLEMLSILFSQVFDVSEPKELIRVRS